MPDDNDVPPLTADELAKDLAASPQEGDDPPGDDAAPKDQEAVVDLAVTRLPPG